MQMKIKLSDNDITFKYDDVLNIGEYINIIQIMRKNNKPELFTKQSIESIKIYIDENDDDLQENLYDLVIIKVILMQ